MVDLLESQLRCKADWPIPCLVALIWTQMCCSDPPSHICVEAATAAYSDIANYNPVQYSPLPYITPDTLLCVYRAGGLLKLKNNYCYSRFRSDCLGRLTNTTV